jgi:hypothetical protein
VADRDDETLARENVGLAERDMIALKLGGAQDQEQRVAVELELGPLVGVQRILDRERVQAELRLDLPQLRLIGLVKADPDEVAGSLRPAPPFPDRDVHDALAAAVGSRRDQLAHRTLPSLKARRRCRMMVLASQPEEPHAVRATDRRAGHCSEPAGRRPPGRSSIYLRAACLS